MSKDIYKDERVWTKEDGKKEIDYLVERKRVNVTGPKQQAHLESLKPEKEQRAKLVRN